jgi:hypothetical protein
MGDLAGPFIVFVIGCAVGALLHWRWQSFWLVSAIATVLGAALWIGGCLLLLALTAPSELGGPLLLVPVLLILITTLAGVLLAGGAVRLLRMASRRANHLCVRCGYDLRATPDRCPECGAAVPRGSRKVFRSDCHQIQ